MDVPQNAAEALMRRRQALLKGPLTKGERNAIEKASETVDFVLSKMYKECMSPSRRSKIASFCLKNPEEEEISKFQNISECKERFQGLVDESTQLFDLIRSEGLLPKNKQEGKSLQEKWTQFIDFLEELNRESTLFRQETNLSKEIKESLIEAENERIELMLTTSELLRPFKVILTQFYVDSAAAANQVQP